MQFFDSSKYYTAFFNYIKFHIILHIFSFFFYFAKNLLQFSIKPYAQTILSQILALKRVFHNIKIIIIIALLFISYYQITK